VGKPTLSAYFPEGGGRHLVLPAEESITAFGPSRRARLRL